jgi:hypothetical protein
MSFADSLVNAPRFGPAHVPGCAFLRSECRIFGVRRARQIAGRHESVTCSPALCHIGSRNNQFDGAVSRPRPGGDIENIYGCIV